MKKMMKLSAGLLLGAMLCLGILVTPQSAEAYYWSCSNPARTFWCANTVVSGGVLYCNVGGWCHVTTPSLDRCYYQRC